MSERRVVITSSGALSPLGITAKENMDRAWAGEVGASDEHQWLTEQLNPGFLGEMHAEIDILAELLAPEERAKLEAIRSYVPGYTRLRTHIAGRIKGYNLLEDRDFPVFAERIPSKDIDREYSPAAIMAVRAGAETVTNGGIADENLQPINIDPERYAIVLGSGIGGAALLTQLSRKLLRNKRPGAKDLFQLQPENPVIVLADLLGAEGPHMLVPKACESGIGGVIQAVRLIKSNEADVVLTGGVEPLNADTVAVFEATSAGYEGTDPMSASLPFNINRSGAVISEGASMLLLEEEEHAKSRGATILGRIDGFGEAGGKGERTALSTEHLFRSVKLALARIRPRDDRNYGYLAHATGTPVGDPGEIAVVLRLMDELGIDLEGRVDTPKVRWMHQLGATGATASIEAVELIERGEFPPVNGADTPPTEDREAIHNGEIEPELRDVIGNGSKKEVDTVIVVGSGFGNQNGAVVIERYEEAT